MRKIISSLCIMGLVVVATAGTTGTLTLVSVPELSTLANVTLASATACTADTTFRPRFNPTTTDGTALTNDPAYTVYPYVSVGDTLVFGCTNANRSNITFKAIIKYDK